ncbi:MAG TPA: flagellar export chaperone FliS [Pirellulales bacterium]|jgi:flagellar protein FliS|nr:flagellar export chaperone FliS [Pirellulales bacterium]
MTPAANDEYLSTEVLTASPQKLQLMLIDAAIRSASRAQSLWTGERTEAVSRSVIYCQAIVAQLIAGLVPNHESPLVQRILAVYEFVHRTLVTVQRRRDRSGLADVLAVLEIERETWRQVCEQLDLRIDTEESLRGPHAALSEEARELHGEFASGISFEA